MNIVLAPDGPLHAGATLARYHLWGAAPARRRADGALLRVLRYLGQLVPSAVRATGPVDDARLVMRIPGVRVASTGEAVAAEVRRIFGLHFDLSGFYRMAKSDAVLAALVEPLYGMRPTLAPTPLEMLVGSISAQQVNLQFAFACRARLVRRWGTPLTLGRHTVWAFPDGAALAQARLREFRAMKLSRRKGEYIRDLARAVVCGRLDLDALAAAPSEAVIERLTQQRGFGRWTAAWGFSASPTRTSRRTCTWSGVTPSAWTGQTTTGPSTPSTACGATARAARAQRSIHSRRRWRGRRRSSGPTTGSG